MGVCPTRMLALVNLQNAANDALTAAVVGNDEWLRRALEQLVGQAETQLALLAERRQEATG